MSKTDFFQVKRLYENTQMPHKIIKLSEMSYIGDNVFNVQGKEILASEHLDRKLDKLVGISGNQREWVQNASDKSGLNNFRNYMQIAYDMHANQEIVLVADAREQKIVDVVPLKEEYLEPHVFLQMVEIFLDNSGYSLTDTFYNPNRLSEGLTLYLQSPDDETIEIADNEVFLPNGVFMRWNFNEIEVGNIFIRMACVNGAMERSTHSQSRIHSFNDKKIQQFLGTTQDIITQGFERYKERVLAAIKTKMSLAELQFAHKSLLNTGLDNGLAEEIIPYNKTLEKAKSQDLPAQTLALWQNLIATGFNMWHTYNLLTTFASHNKMWNATDVKRQQILVSASKLLNKKPDIKQYLEII